MSEPSDKAPTPNAGQSSSEAQFGLQKIYLKDTSFETPNSPAVFTEKWEPSLNVELQSSGNQLADNLHEVVLTVTVTAKLGEKTAYLVEVHQAGVFMVKGVEGEQLAHMLGSYVPGILFPFAREAIADIIAKGGFPQLLLAPVNFDALYAQHRAQLARQKQAADLPSAKTPVH